MSTEEQPIIEAEESQIVEGLSEGILVNEDGSYSIAKADGTGEVEVTAEDLEKGMITFGKEISVNELLQNTGANLKNPTITALRSFVTSNIVNQNFLLDACKVSYSYDRMGKVGHRTKNEKGDLVVEYVEKHFPEVIICEDRFGQPIETDQTTKLARRLANFIEEEIIQSVNENIQSFDVVRSIETGITTITLRRSESSTYSFLLRI